MKPFFNEQYITLEENNRRGHARDLFRKTGNIKGTFCPKMGTIKDRNHRDFALQNVWLWVTNHTIVAIRFIKISFV